MQGRQKKSRARVERDRACVNNALKNHLARLKGPSLLRKAMDYAVFSGGKRLRPILTMESSRVLGGDVKRALPFACAVELVHNFSLVHDDLPAMDNDARRRGKPTCHKKFGENIAILAGDGLLNLAFGIIAELSASGGKAKKTLEAISLLADAVGSNNMIGGQALDLKKPPPKSLGRYKINRMKTAALMACSCKIGALAAEGKARDVERIYEFGKNLGLAFQIADDIEDSAHGELLLKRMRKETASFISEGKSCIAPFGEKADTLGYIADRVLEKANGKAY